MRTLYIVICLLLCQPWIASRVSAHDMHDHNHADVKTWNFATGEAPVKASFLMFKNDKIYLEKENHRIIEIPLKNFSREDQIVLTKKIAAIELLNQPSTYTDTKKNEGSVYRALLILIVVLSLIYFMVKKRTSLSAAYMACIVVVAGFFGFTAVEDFFSSDPLVIDRAFQPFKPAVNTFWDNDYFYVESKGIPNHEMMTGITKWQQQVPIPQCYIGTNAWQFPLNPVLAETPVPVNQEHFLRGAIAIAANGVPIFNPYTNTGLDALVDGQLDKYGGHSGRADDYHYHIAPLQLHTLGQTAPSNPIAYALDGFAVYGALEPDGSPMKPLDENHGHFGSDGIYHYHGTPEKPYMIGKMVGKVTEDATLQIIPQPRANPVRPSLTPLSGATITDCIENSSGNGYKLTYIRNNQEYGVDYSWSPAGKYTFHFINPTGTTTEVYNGFVQCNIPTATAEEIWSNSIQVYPNPSSNSIRIDMAKTLSESDIKNITLFNVKGETVLKTDRFTEVMDVSTVPKGVYFMNFAIQGKKIMKKVIIQ